MDLDNGFRALQRRCLKSSWNIRLIKSHRSIELVGQNPRAASGFKDVYKVWLKRQVLERLTVLSPDIGFDDWNGFPDFVETIH